MTNKNILEDINFNLSDFALFLSVMKNKKAYQNTLSIILDEPDIQLKEVKVEQVILNKTGQRAIRLDAWAVSTDERQFNMEMENYSEKDSVPKRARFYQGLKRDLAKYTFIEKCKEIEDLELEDGTTKIFLNMTSKNGSKELVSMLQYMKDTRLDNPELLVKDRRIIELDEIVNEVKESEEWEGIKMNILDIGIQEGERRGIKAMIEVCKSLDATRDKVCEMVIEKFTITKEDAEKYMEMYW